ncbi:DUF1253-domain-containing protein [Polychaeton citri CBS 116435]|uniref:U3 small nucleolar RNA-associated protein 25 n=1 Tax=Polychaeton citri CBS 116435 TaxID=1314669 RepID=A0A9P4UQF3_9PEZI|nr:DUF1253-domain-containing protein [Polychaeton citri CBS 116435]
MAQYKGNARGKGAARSGIRLKNGQYKKFDSQRIKDVESEEDESPHQEEQTDAPELPEDEDDSDDSEDGGVISGTQSYNAMLQSFAQPKQEHPRKRRRVDRGQETVHHVTSNNISHPQEDEPAIEAEDGDNDDDEEDTSDPYNKHLAPVDEARFSALVHAAAADQWRTERVNLTGHQSLGKHSVGKATVLVPKINQTITHRKPLEDIKGLNLKRRLQEGARKLVNPPSTFQSALAPYMYNYSDLLAGIRTPDNASELRNLACLHALNHVLKSRDKILKNNARQLEVGDQGFTRPKVLILSETRQMCAKYAETISTLFNPEQQENKQRFRDTFVETIDNNPAMPEDFNELFEGNNDNNFLTALKFTRKTLKYFSAFYRSDIILASPLGLRRIIEHEDKKKRDYDFLSSIEVVIVDQGDAMQMQSFENITTVFKHLNHWPQDEEHRFDINRVRQWYLDQQAKHLRQTIVFSAYITPELNSLFNTQMSNIAGKLRLSPSYDGAISTNAVSGLGFKQTFSRFDCPSPSKDPDARFQFFTSAVLPSLLRLPKPADGAQGILVFIPSYFDFLRIRNYFATSTQTQNTSFGTIHDYSEVSEQRRARSHFLTGRHSILLYTQRAHHFYRIRMKGVKRVVMYGLPDNPSFYGEMVGGFIGTTLGEGRASPEECSAKCTFSKWDGLRLERVVGSDRFRSMLEGNGDTFDFL